VLLFAKDYEQLFRTYFHLRFKLISMRAGAFRASLMLHGKSNEAA